LKSDKPSTIRHGILNWPYNFSTFRPLDSLTVCFHRHSRFVPSIPQSSSREVEELRGLRQYLELRLGLSVGSCLRPLNSSTPPLLDFLDLRRARPILAYKLTCSLPSNFPVVENLRAPTAFWKGWRGLEHLAQELSRIPSPYPARPRQEDCLRQSIVGRRARRRKMRTCPVP
jgi:hypothetical protein